MSLFQNYENLWKAFIRPIRQKYSQQDLGPSLLKIGNQVVLREDIELQSKSGHDIQCSYFQLHDLKTRQNIIQNTVIYLHTNSGSRIEALPYLEMLLSNQMNLFCFDFTGSGNSQGQFITLGYKEKMDVETVIQYLRDRLSLIKEDSTTAQSQLSERSKTFQMSDSDEKAKNQSCMTIQPAKNVKLALWGRSMGAATTLLAAQNLPELDCIIVDSAFSNLSQLTKEIAKKNMNLPNFLISAGIKIINSSVQKKAGFNIKDININEAAKKCQQKALFIGSQEDSFVSFSHTQALYENYAGKNKQIYICKGNHNAERDTQTKDEILKFLKNNFESKSCCDLDSRYSPESIRNISPDTSTNATQVQMNSFSEKNIIKNTNSVAQIPIDYNNSSNYITKDCQLGQENIKKSSIEAMNEIKIENFQALREPHQKSSQNLKNNLRYNNNQFNNINFYKSKSNNFEKLTHNCPSKNNDQILAVNNNHQNNCKQEKLSISFAMNLKRDESPILKEKNKMKTERVLNCYQRRSYNYPINQIKYQVQQEKENLRTEFKNEQDLYVRDRSYTFCIPEQYDSNNSKIQYNQQQDTSQYPKFKNKELNVLKEITDLNNLSFYKKKNQKSQILNSIDEKENLVNFCNQNPKKLYKTSQNPMTRSYEMTLSKLAAKSISLFQNQKKLKSISEMNQTFQNPKKCCSINFKPEFIKKLQNIKVVSVQNKQSIIHKKNELHQKNYSMLQN